MITIARLLARLLGRRHRVEGRGRVRDGVRARRSRGQIVVIFAMMLTVLLGMAALVVDVAWYWSNSLRVQRAADAAALAGAVDLPGDAPTAYADARAEAAKNGYSDGVGGVVVTPVQDQSNSRRLVVRIQAPVSTFFMRVFGFTSIQADRTSRAEFVLPVPMGSPENYYGVFGDVRGATMTSPQVTQQSTADTAPASGWVTASAYYPNGGAGNWTNPARADGNNNNQSAVSTTSNGSSQAWGNFGLTFSTPVETIDGITVRYRAAISGSGGSTSDCQVQVALSYNNGGNWSNTKTNRISTTETQYTQGGATDGWGRIWSANELANGQFRVRLTWNKVTCGANRTVSVDTLEVQVDYHWTQTISGQTTTTSTYALHGPGAPCLNGVANCFQGTPAGGGQVLNPRGFWATMNTQGAENVNGDAFQPYYDDNNSNPTKAAPTCPGPAGRACYGEAEHYNYAIEMQPNTSGGYVYVFDPVFCATQVSRGTGDRWFSGSNPVSSFFELYSDPNNTPYDLSDDVSIASSGNLFRQVDASDSTMGGSGGANECRQTDQTYNDGRDFHNSWYLLNPNHPLTGGPNGTTYRLHTTGTDPNNASQQRNTDGEQSFAIYATDAQAPNVYPKVYGLGSMQAFTPLSAAGSATQSEFYLAKIEAIHAGKTLTIGLWDPGDTSPLSAYLEILIPTNSGWQATPLNYTASVGTTNSGATGSCNSNTGTGVTTITTADPNSKFNGCWLTIDVAIPSNYQAYQDGWWKIRYTMNGNGTSNDVTTWTAEIRGNPVHLVVQ